MFSVKTLKALACAVSTISSLVRYRRPAHRKPLCDVDNGKRTGTKLFEDGPPGRIAQSIESYCMAICIFHSSRIILYGKFILTVSTNLPFIFEIPTTGRKISFLINGNYDH